MSANFKSGEVLTAAGLNDAINGILPGRRTSVAPGLQGSVRQNRVPVPVVEAERPVYLDKAIMVLKDGEPEGWYIQQNGQLVHLPNVRENAPVYLVIHTDSDGRETSREWTSTQQVAQMWDPMGRTPGRVVRLMGRTAVNPFVPAGVGSQRFIFYPVDGNKVQPELVLFEDKCDLPQGVKEFSLVLEQRGNTRPVRMIQSAGGLIEVPPVSGTEARQPLALAPRVSLFEMPPSSDMAPATGYSEDPETLMMGSWQSLASLTVGGQLVQLMGYWVTPWRVGLAFEPRVVDVAGGGVPEKLAWQGETPVVGQNPHGLGPWKRVSYTPGVPLVTPGVPIDCGYEVYDYAVYEAPGTYAPGTDSSAMQRVLWVAQMRRQRHPLVTDWVYFEKTELTAPLT